MGFRKAVSLAAISSLAMGFWLQSGVVQAESLADAMRAAYRGNPTLNADRARQRGTDELVPIAKSGWRPTVTAGAVAQQQWSDTNVSAPQDSGSLNLNIQLSQPVFRGFRTVESVKSAKSTVEAGRQQLLATEQAVLYSVAVAYLGVVRDRQIVAIRQQNINNLQKQAKAAAARFEVGEVTRTDVSQSRARVSAAQGDLASAKANLEASIAAYIAAVGHKPGKVKYSRLGKVPASLDAALAISKDINPQILAASWVHDASRHDVKVAEGVLLPEVSLKASGSVTYSSGNGPLDRTDQALVQGVLSVPIYQSGREHAAVRQAKQVASQRQVEIIEATRSVRQQVAQSWYALVAASQSITAAKAQVAAAALALDGINQEYLVGSRTTIDVLNAQQEVLGARLGLITAEHGQMLSTYQLLQAMGKLTAKNLGLGGGYYEPKSNYENVKDKWIGTGIIDE